MASGDNQLHEEREIFSLFAEASGFRIRPESIQNRKPPEPDILCEIVGDGLVAFEMVSLTSSEALRLARGGHDLQRRFEDEICKWPELRANFSDAIIHIDFHQAAPKQRRQGSIKELLDILQNLPVAFEGVIPLRRKSPLSRILNEITIQRGISDGPSFDLIPACEEDRDIVDLISRKLQKENAYRTSYPLELLAYFGWQRPPRMSRLSPLESYLKTNLGKSPFRRVWVYDYFSRRVLYRYPDPAS